MMFSGKTPLINISHDALAIFKSRPNRFLGIVDIVMPEKYDNINVHIHDPGRLNDLLVPGAEISLKKATAHHRKTQWDLIAVKKEEQWVLVHAGYHRQIMESMLQHDQISPFGRLKKIQPEVKFEHSRLDFLIEQVNGQQIWLEVKGCTLVQNGIALFPDAPTKRGTRHLQTLMTLTQRGIKAAIIFLVFRNEAHYFAPHNEIDPEFASQFKQAITAGVEVFPIKLIYENGIIFFTKNLSLHEQI